MSARTPAVQCMCVDASSIARRHRERRVKHMLKILFGVVHYSRSEGVDRAESDGIRNWTTVIEEAFSLYLLSWTGPCNTPGPCNTRLIQPITIDFSHSFRYIYKLYTTIIFSVKFETLLNVSIEDIVNSRTHLV